MRLNRNRDTLFCFGALSCIVLPVLGINVERVEVETSFISIDGNEAAYYERNGSAEEPFTSRFGIEFTEEFDSGLEFKFDGDFELGTDENDIEIEFDHYDWGEFALTFRTFSTFDYPVGSYLSDTDELYEWSDNVMKMDTEYLSVSTKLLREGLPEVQFRYQRSSREGEKGSTIWTENNQSRPATGVRRGIVPSVIQVDETSDRLELGLTQAVGRLDFDLAYGHEETATNEIRYLDRAPSEEESNRKVAQTEVADSKADYARFKIDTKSLWQDRVRLSLASSYYDFSSDFSGSRIYGDAFDSPYSSEVGNRLVDDNGFVDLVGNSDLEKYLSNLNVLIRLNKYWRLLIAGQLSKVSSSSYSDFIETGITRISGSLDFEGLESNRDGASEDDYDELSGQLELRYSKWDPLKLYLRAEVSGGDGYIRENYYGNEVTPVVEDRELQIARENDYTRNERKVTLGGNWMIARGLFFSARCRLTEKKNQYDPILRESEVSSRMEYPNYLLQHEKTEVKGSASLNWKAHNSLRFSTLIGFSNYDLDTLGIESDFIESGTCSERNISQSVFWTLSSRCQINLLAYYSGYDFETPANLLEGSVESLVPAVDNSSWYTSISGNYVFKNETSLQLTLSSLDIDSYRDNSEVSTPYGSLLAERTVNIMYNLPLGEETDLNIGYVYEHSRDEAYADHLDYTANQVYLGYRKKF
ncbi:hypothetical protein MLD52_14405 [Puniceicoccaceae bacterium K14]|nr:hypothetical protein [Puniceicoccaceae bacterium K14]